MVDGCKFDAAVGCKWSAAVGCKWSAVPLRIAGALFELCAALHEPLALVCGSGVEVDSGSGVQVECGSGVQVECGAFENCRCFV